jgi:hypothetical protein
LKGNPEHTLKKLSQTQTVAEQSPAVSGNVLGPAFGSAASSQAPPGLLNAKFAPLENLMALPNS